jgi:pyruvate dehydrogenase E2 component (dihydrolipoamide acetyltransferase)
VFVSKKEDVEAFENYTVESEVKKPVDSAKEKSAEVVKEAAIEEKTKEPVQEQQTPTIPAASQTSQDFRVKASPLAKKIAEEKGVNLNGLTGSGPSGRIIKNDVLSFKPSTTPTPQAASNSKFIDLPLSNMRKVIAARLTESKRDIPHYYLKVDIEMDRIMELRSKFNSTPLLQETFGTFKLSVNDFIVKAAALALKKVPECNSSWYGEYIRKYETVDLCVAVATPSGLITPIVSDADKKGLILISEKVKELAARAKINKLKPEEYQVSHKLS